MTVLRHTGIVATAEERKELLKLVRRAEATPVFALSSAHALERGGFSGEAWTAVHQRCHAMALRHGLPEISGYYGINLEDGEFLAP